MKVQIKRLDSVTHNDTTATKLINDNFKAIQDEIELQLSRDGKEPNFMDADLDMNSHKIINSAYPTEDIDVATKEYVDDVAGNAAEYAAQASASAARAAVSEQHAAVYAQVAEDARAQVDGLINNDGFKAVAEDLQSADSSIKKTANNIEDIHKAALLDPTSIEKAGLVGEHINEILPVSDHLNEIDTVSANIASVNTVSTNIANVNKVAAVDESVEVVATNIGSVNTVSTNIGSVNTVSTNIDNVNRVAPNADKLSQLDDDVEQLLKQINGEGGLDSMVSGDNVTQASASARGTARFATDSEVQAGTSTDVMITPKQLKQFGGGGGGTSVDTYTKTEIDSMFNNVATVEEGKANVDADNFTAIGKSAIADVLYPVGSIYIGVQTECPLKAVIQGSTWVKVSEGRVLQGSDSSHEVGTTIAAGLPNITGELNNTAYVGDYYARGAFRSIATGGNLAGAASSDAGAWNVYFDASKSNSIYGNSKTVQPPAFVVNIWKRTA